jgi:hypothetical protein
MKKWRVFQVSLFGQRYSESDATFPARIIEAATADEAINMAFKEAPRKGLQFLYLNAEEITC